MDKIIEFENKLSDLITETFKTKKELEKAIEDIGDNTLLDYFIQNMEYYE